MRLRKIMAGQYQTLDGRYNIEFDKRYLEGECECALCLNGSPECPNDGWGKIEAWHIWDNENGDYMDGTGPEQFETLAEAREHLTPAPEAAAMREP